MIFVDTSALYAVLDRDDQNHPLAKRTWSRSCSDGRALLVTNYVVVETTALLQHRLGMEAVRVLCGDVLPALICIGLAKTSTGMRRMPCSRRSSKLSLVDCSSFHVMSSRMMRTAFAFDPHFREQGFDVLPDSIAGDAARTPTNDSD